MMLVTTALAAAPPSLEDPHRTGTRSEHDAAVVIGNEDYAYLPDVPYAERDADAVYSTMLYTVGIPAERIGDLRGASREQILQAVTDGAKSVGTEGTLWVYFAGHGAASLASGERMLVGDDAKPDPSIFDQRAVALSELEKAAGETKLVLLLDTCFTGTGRGGEPLVPGARFAVPSWAASEVRSFSAAGPDQVAGAWTSAGHGWFTYFLVGAMRGWADGEIDGLRDGAVSAAEADAYVKRSLSTLQVTDQRPQLSATDATAWVLSRGASEKGPDLSLLDRGGGPVQVGAARDQLPTGRRAPIAHVSGSLYRDAADQPVAWLEVKELARKDPAGLAAVRARGVNTGLQVVAATFATEFLVAGPVTWGLGAAECRQDEFYCGIQSMGITLTVIGAAFAGWETALIVRRHKIRGEALDAANRVLTP